MSYSYEDPSFFEDSDEELIQGLGDNAFLTLNLIFNGGDSIPRGKLEGVLVDTVNEALKFDPAMSEFYVDQYNTGILVDFAMLRDILKEISIDEYGRYSISPIMPPVGLS
jgi:hypothetical protein